jgi:superfamily II DNA/RNA helicase
LGKIHDSSFHLFGFFYLFIQVEHVIQFDFPRFISDYIHRAGRVGRIGSKKVGKVSSFVTQPNEINLAQKIEVIKNKNHQLIN